MATRPTNSDDAAPRDEMGELDTLVSSLVAEMNEAADEITRVMRPDDDEEGAAADAVAMGQALTDSGALDRDEGEDEDHEAEASSPDDEPDEPDMTAESIDAALADVASQLQADLDSASPAPAPVPESDSAEDDAHESVDEHAAADETDPGAESIAAQIDEELARAFREEVGEPAEPAVVADAATTAAVPEAEAPADSAVEDEVGESEPEEIAEADPVGERDESEDAVNAVAETIDRLLDAPDDESAPRAVAVTEEEAEEHAAQPSDALVEAPESETEPDASTEDAKAEEDDEEEPVVEAVAPTTPPAPAPAPAAPASKKAPAPKATPPAPPTPPVPPASDEAPKTRRFPITIRLPGGVGSLATAALVVVNKPLLKLPRQLRDTLGLAGLVTLFNAACLWVFLMLR